jgi:hypothetical protein
MTGFHAVPRGATWAVRRAGGLRALKTRLTRDEAWCDARRRARAAGAVAYLFDKTGRIVAREAAR